MGEPIDRYIFPTDVRCSKKKLSDAKVACENGEFVKAIGLYDSVLAEYPSYGPAAEDRKTCLAERNDPRTVDVSFLLEPGIYVDGYSGGPLYAKFSLYIDDNFCGILKNTGAPDVRRCDADSSSMAKMSVKNIYAQKQNGEMVISGGSCNGVATFPPKTDKYFMVMCFRNVIKCRLVPEDEIENFSAEKCPFE
jgi:hypothetical protein